MHPSPTALAKAKNEQLSCSLSHCTSARHGFNTWCRQHAARAARLGHPLAASYRPSAWASQRREVEALFKANTAHKGLQQAVQHVADLMAQAKANQHARKGARELHRLAVHGVTPERVVVELAAAWRWLGDNPRALPSDRAEDFFISRAVFALAPRPRRGCGTLGRISGTWGISEHSRKSYAPKALPSALASIGHDLRQTLGVFMANTCGAVESMRALKADPHAFQRAPLALPVAPRPGLPFPVPER